MTRSLIPLCFVTMLACGGDGGAPECLGVGCTCTDSACKCEAGTDCKTECHDSACSLVCTQASKCQGNSTDELSVTSGALVLGTRSVHAEASTSGGCRQTGTSGSGKPHLEGVTDALTYVP